MNKQTNITLGEKKLQIKALPTQYELLKTIRKPLPRPAIKFLSKKQYKRSKFKKDW